MLTIGARAFANCAISGITIPKSVKTINKEAFKYCRSLKTVTFEEDINLESLDQGVFSCCTELLSITLPKSLKNIDQSVFSFCSALETVTIEEGSALQTIGDSAFKNCYALKTINIPDSVTFIGINAFGGCSALETVTMEEGSALQTIGKGAFLNCYALKTINIPDSVTFIGIDAFEGCSNLTYTTYGGAYYLGNATNPYVVLVKAENTDLESCTIHENTKIIYQYAFKNCSNLYEVEIPDGVVCIGQRAFENCDLNMVILYASVTSIGENAFLNNYNVNLYYCGIREQWDAIKKGEYGNIGVNENNIMILG